MAVIAAVLLAAGCGQSDSDEAGLNLTVPTATVDDTIPSETTQPPLRATTEATEASEVLSIAETLTSTPRPTSAEEMAEALSAVEQTLRNDDLSLSDEELSSIGRYQQGLYRQLTFQPDWQDTVLASVAEDIAPAVALNWEARENLQELLAIHHTADSLPAWRVSDPFPAAELLGYYKEAEATTGIDWEYVAAINLVETRMGRIQGISTAGAVGPMQFLPTTWAECCDGDPTQPRDAIIGAATYLTHRGGPENMDKAIWGYNNSDFYVNAVKAYAEVLRADERAYFGYHGWGVYFLTTEGLIFIEEGYEQAEEIPAAEWLAQYPETLITG